ncbi:MAG: rhodanese-related sulfurtransferase [Cyclobacteriaceae bacterium]|nr:rhodanese-related sulfurtransferase [Cyclobacteriaceae bacterium]
MKRLYNQVDKQILKQRLHTQPQDRTTLSFYKYHHIADPVAFRDFLYQQWIETDVMGRVYVAEEGINAQISVPNAQFESFKQLLYSVDFLNGIRLNTAIEDDGKSFFKLKIQVKKKIVADGLNDKTFDASDSGKDLNAKEFNALSAQPGTVVVDMRNHYESEVGHFKNAILPDVDTFREALPVAEKLLEDKKDSNIIMYCTGGIRCEKASAWMKHRGFKNVFQLEGGIIEYARQVKSQGLENKFVGKNFVFDERLGERISEEIISVCHQCGQPCDTHTNCRNEACHLLFIQCEECAKKFDGCCSSECKEIVALEPAIQKELRKGKAQGRMVYKKGRSANIKFRAEATTAPHS